MNALKCNLVHLSHKDMSNFKHDFPRDLWILPTETINLMNYIYVVCISLAITFNGLL